MKLYSWNLKKTIPWDQPSHATLPLLFLDSPEQTFLDGRLTRHLLMWSMLSTVSRTSLFFFVQSHSAATNTPQICLYIEIAHLVNIARNNTVCPLTCQFVACTGNPLCSITSLTHRSLCTTNKVKVDGRWLTYLCGGERCDEGNFKNHFSWSAFCHLKA